MNLDINAHSINRNVIVSALIRVRRMHNNGWRDCVGGIKCAGETREEYRQSDTYDTLSEHEKREKRGIWFVTYIPTFSSPLVSIFPMGTPAILDWKLSFQ